MTIDESTNLPELPDNYYWHAYYSLPGEYSLYTKLHLSLIEKLPPRWYNKNRTKVVGHKYYALSEEDKSYIKEGTRWSMPKLLDPNVYDYDNILFQMAEELYSQRRVSMEQEIIEKRVIEKLKELKGDYQPKRLETRSESGD